MAGSRGSPGGIQACRVAWPDGAGATSGKLTGAALGLRPRLTDCSLRTGWAYGGGVSCHIRHTGAFLRLRGACTGASRPHSCVPPRPCRPHTGSPPVKTVEEKRAEARRGLRQAFREISAIDSSWALGGRCRHPRASGESKAPESRTVHAQCRAGAGRRLPRPAPTLPPGAAAPSQRAALSWEPRWHAGRSDPVSGVRGTRTCWATRHGRPRCHPGFLGWSDQSAWPAPEPAALPCACTGSSLSATEATPAEEPNRPRGRLRGCGC